jgi:hypothetical protein
MSFESDYRAEAAMAMEFAARATNEPERLSWLRIALAWRELARLPHVNNQSTLSSQDTPPSSTLKAAPSRGGQRA